MLRLRYEDLLADPGPEVARLVGFLGLDAGAARIADAIAGASFGALRALEEREIGARQSGLFWRESYGAGHARGHRFINRGGAGFGQDLLTEGERARLAGTFRAELELLGYADAVGAAGVPVAEQLEAGEVVGVGRQPSSRSGAAGRRGTGWMAPPPRLPATSPVTKV